MISGIYAKFPIRMMLSPNSTLDVRMDFSLPEWSNDEWKLKRVQGRAFDFCRRFYPS